VPGVGAIQASVFDSPASKERLARDDRIAYRRTQGETHAAARSMGSGVARLRHPRVARSKAGGRVTLMEIPSRVVGWRDQRRFVAARMSADVETANETMV
jgi:hypothetical protein